MKEGWSGGVAGPVSRKPRQTVSTWRKATWSELPRDHRARAEAWVENGPPGGDGALSLDLRRILLS